MKYKVGVRREEFCEIEVEAECELEARVIAMDEAIDSYENQCWETLNLYTQIIED